MTAAYHEQVPRDPTANVRWRLAFFDAVRAAGRVGVEAARLACEEDFLFFVNAFAVQLNSKNSKTPIGPFATYPFQDKALKEILAHITEGRDLAMQKSRQIGASWMSALVAVWLWNFKKAQTVHLVSHIADLVFKRDDEKSLYFKVDYILHHLPGWLLPEKWTDTNDQYTNHDNGSTITGEATTKKAGVGGNKTVVFLDEFAQNEQGTTINQRTTETTNCRIFVSTHLGTDTEFFQIIDRGDTDVLTLHWSEHPIYRRGLYRYDPDANLVDFPDRIVRLDAGYALDPAYPFVRTGLPAGGPFPGVRSPWYDEQCKRKGSARAVAMDLDIDPAGSASQFFDALLIARLKAKDARPPLWSGRLLYDRDDATPKSLAQDDKGPLKLWEELDWDDKPEPGLYVIGFDVSYGRGATPQVAIVYRVIGGRARQVARYSNAYIGAEDFGVLGAALAKLFCDRRGVGATIIWENQGASGGSFRDGVLKTGYRNVYFDVDISRQPPVRSDKPGYNMNDKRKTYILEQLHAGLARGDVQLRDAVVLEECLEFRYDQKGNAVHSRSKNRDRPEESGEAHSDHAMAAAIGLILVAEVSAGGAGEKEAGEMPAAHPYSLAGRVRMAETESSSSEQWW